MKMDVIKILPENYDEVILHLRNNFFCDEPLNASLQLTQRGEPHEQLENHSYSTMKDGLSLMAIDQTNCQIAGVVLNGILRKNDVYIAIEKLESINDEKFKKIFQFLYEQNIKADIFNKYNVDELFECRILSVGSDYRGKGIAKLLLKHSLDLAAKNNFKLFKEDATGFYSQRAAESFGIHTVLELNYSDIKDQYGNQIFKLSAPHEKFKIMIKELTSNNAVE